MNVVLDCSVTMAWLFEDEKSTKSEKILNNLTNGYTAYVPSLWAWEVNNVLLVAERRARVTRAQVAAFVQLLDALPIKFDDKGIYSGRDTAYDLALEFNLSAYDAAYLELALRRNIPIASLDKQVVNASKKLGLLLK